MNILYIISTVIFLIILVIINKYNKLVKARNQVENSKSSLDALFIKRSDLIPNLITLVKEYMTFEKETLDHITSLRTVTTNSNSKDENQGIDAIKNLMIQVENYPDLKANTQFTNLQYSWNEAEEQISAGRRYVSISITNYNDTVKTFPNNIIASIAGFSIQKWDYATNDQKQNLNANELFTKK